jgi:predicted membrane protein
MSKPLLTKRKADALSNGIFLVCLGILFYSTTAWWPGILLAIWAALATRQYLTGRIYDLIMSSVILLGLFLVITFSLDWSTLMPVLFILGGAYLVFREYYFVDPLDKEEQAERLKQEIKTEVKEEIQQEKRDGE